MTTATRSTRSQIQLWETNQKVKKIALKKAALKPKQLKVGSKPKPKPRLKGSTDTAEQMRRKGSFLIQQFTDPKGPMLKDGNPTRLALSAQAWGEPVPKTEAAARRLAEKGRKLLEKSHAAPVKVAKR